MRIGIIGISDGNGHPFSFSAIINGYSDKGFAESGWPLIHKYVKERRPDEFGFDEIKVTHAWTQDDNQTQKLCAAAKIEHALSEPETMLGEVDAVLIARDDWHSHYPLSKPFLDAGLPVFIDKPLSLDPKELEYFKPYLECGKLMSCSGLRFAKELRDVNNIGATLCLNGTVVQNWERYGVHLLDAAFNTRPARPISIARHPASHEAFTIAMDDGSVFNVNAIGEAPKIFRLDYFASREHVRIDMNDNFTAFRATLERFFEMCRTGMPAIDPKDTLTVMHTLMAGLAASKGGPHVRISDIAVHDPI